MAVAAAREYGVHVDETASNAHVQMMEAQWTGLQELVLQRVNIGGFADNQTYSLMGMAAARYPASAITDAMVTYVAGMQHQGGQWRLRGISRPPFEDSTISRTALGLRVMQLYGWPARKAEFDERIARARAFLMEAKPMTADDGAMQLAGLWWAGAQREKVAELAKALIALQHADGGWSSNPRLASDALSTGEALWALHQCGMLSTSDPVYQRGAKYLLSTQWSDGSWYVRSRSPKFQPYFQSGFPFDHDQWISSTGTAFAVMALAPAVEKEKRAAR